MPHSQKNPGSGLGGLAAAGPVLLPVACCAGPLLIAAGALSVAGGLLRSPAVLAAAALALVGAIPYVRRRRRSGQAAAASLAHPQDDTHTHRLATPALRTGRTEPPNKAKRVYRAR